MSGLTALALGAAEGLPLPDTLVRAGIWHLVERTRRRLDGVTTAQEQAFVCGMAAFPIAEHTADANAQHYELPAAFFEQILGPRRKYSSCLYAGPDDTLAVAEERALSETLEHAGLVDGQDILELGCGWGSLTLWMAERLPQARVTAVSNSHAQRVSIEAAAAARQLDNITVVTADMNSFAPSSTYDRIVSVEMFEHMANWRSLLARARSWLKPEGRLFLHVFTHRTASYRFDPGDKDDWIALHFFTGGVMPSHTLVGSFPDLFAIEREWLWSGEHYRRTAEDWLKNFDLNRRPVDRILLDHYGRDAALWRRRWRLFFLATAGLFGHDRGRVWGVSHYLLRPLP